AVGPLRVVLSFAVRPVAPAGPLVADDRFGAPDRGSADPVVLRWQQSARPVGVDGVPGHAVVGGDLGDSPERAVRVWRGGPGAHRLLLVHRVWTKSSYSPSTVLICSRISRSRLRRSRDSASSAATRSRSSCIR